MKKIFLLLTLVILLGCGGAAAQPQDSFWARKFPAATGQQPRNLLDRLSETVNLKSFGAKGDGVADDTAAINLAIAAAFYRNPTDSSRRAGREIYAPLGQYKISSTIGFTNFHHLRFRGDSQATTFVWAGPTNVAAFRVVNGSGCVFSEFRIRADGPSLPVGIEQITQNNTGPDYTLPSSGNQYRQVTIESASGQLGIGWRLGGDSNGLLPTSIGDDLENDFTRFDDCWLFNYTVAGWDIEQANNFDTSFYNCRAYAWSADQFTPGAAYGIYSYAANFNWKGGFMAFNGCNFFTESQSPAAYEVAGLDSEKCASFWNTGGYSSAMQRITLRNCRLDTSSLSNSAFVFTKTGQINIADNLFGTISQTNQSVKFDLFTHYPQQTFVTIVRNTIYSTNSLALMFPNFQADVFEGNVVVSNNTYYPQRIRRAATAHDFFGSLDAHGGLVVTNIAVPSINVNYSGTAGSATWGYEVTALTDTGETLPSIQFTAAAASSTLSLTKQVQIRILGGNNVSGAASYNIYRTLSGGTPSTLGLITNIAGPFYGSLVEVDDIGLSASGQQPPTVDTSGLLIAGTALAYQYESGLGGYITPGNIGGVGNAAYFPLGISTPAGVTNHFLGNFHYFDGYILAQGGTFGLSPAGNLTLSGDASALTLTVTGLPVYANNAAALAGGLVAGKCYRTGATPDPVCVVH
jgi:hypothetical protein